MNVKDLLRTVEKTTVDNSPLILTAVAVAGVISTGVLAARGGVRAGKELEYYNYELEQGRRANLLPDLTPREIIEITWKEFIPAVGMGALTIVAVVGANRIGTRRAAALAAAYSVSEKTLVQYKEKVVEKFGENKERELRDEIAQDRVNENPPSKEIVIIEGKSLVCDLYSGRYFESTMEKLKKAQNDFTYYLNSNGYASLTEYYDEIGLPSTSHSDDVGWTSDTKFDVSYTTCLSEDGRPCIAIDFTKAPKTAYYKFS